MTVLKYYPLQTTQLPARLKVIKHPFFKGMQIPGSVAQAAIANKHWGAVGNWAEREMEKMGWQISSVSGANIPHYCLELQTRKKKSRSRLSSGTMMPVDIVSTKWEKSVFAEKMQYQLRLYWDAHSQTLSEVEFYDFTFPEIQQTLKSAYETLREQIMLCMVEDEFVNPLPKTATNQGNSARAWDVIFELNKSFSYSMRFSASFFRRIESRSRQLPVESKFLEFS